jgi:hypothetical protein
MLLPDLLLRNSRRRASVNPAPIRIEVCPPALFRGHEPFLKRCIRWITMPAPPLMPLLGVDGVDKLCEVREEFAESLHDVGNPHAHYLRDRVLRCRSMRELWHLRPEIFNLIAVRHSQEEAERRLAPLNRHFPTRSPRSGFAPLDP